MKHKSAAAVMLAALTVGCCLQASFWQRGRRIASVKVYPKCNVDSPLPKMSLGVAGAEVRYESDKSREGWYGLKAFEDNEVLIAVFGAKQDSGNFCSIEIRVSSRIDFSVSVENAVNVRIKHESGTFANGHVFPNGDYLLRVQVVRADQ